MSNEVINELFITTKDNPFNPFKQFNDWYSFDCNRGYNTCALIDRVMDALFNSNENENEELNEVNRTKAIKQIVKVMPEFYSLVSNNTFVETIPIDMDNSIDDTQ